MRVVIVGGSGLIGSRLSTALEETGHEVVIASRRTGIDSFTGEGLTAALTGADVVVDVTNPPDFGRAEEFFSTSTRNLVNAESRLGVGAHVILSIVGIDRVPRNAYYAAKLAQERVARASEMKVVSLRATQFFEFIDTLLPKLGDASELTVSTEPLQPVAADDVVRELARIVTAPPVPGTRRMAGPQIIPLDEYVRRTLAARGDDRVVIARPGSDTLALGGVADALLLGEDPGTLGATTFTEWLQSGAGFASSH